MKRRLTIRLGPTAVAAMLAGCMSVQPTTEVRPSLATARIDPKAVTVLQAMDDAFLAAEGIEATYRSEVFSPNGKPAGVETSTLRLGRPNVFLVERATSNSRRLMRIKGGDTIVVDTVIGKRPYQLRRIRGGDTTFVDTTFVSKSVMASNGAKLYRVFPGGSSSCMVSDVGPNNETRETSLFNPVYWSFYDLGVWHVRSALLGHWATTWRMNDPGLRSVRYVGLESAAGVPVDVVEWKYTIGYNYRDDDPLYTSRLSIGPDHFVRRIETTSNSKNEYDGRRIVETLTDIRATPRPSVADFAYTPPPPTPRKVGENGPSRPGQKLDAQGCGFYNEEDSYTTGKYVDLPIGSKAPDFTLRSAQGETIKLSEFLRKHKVILMNFWGYG